VAEIATKVPAGFKILSGDDSLTLPIVAVGGKGVIAVVSNEAPAQMTALARACLENDWDVARRLNRQLFPLMKANFIETSPGPVKAALAMMGKIKEKYRLPMVPVKAETKETLRAILAELKLIEGSKSMQAE
jgi:4-hydroxy-tetrahydrodipicolinate synthase